MQPSRSSSHLVMAGLDPAILFPAPKKRIPGSSPGMTGGGHQQSPSSSPARPLNQVQREVLLALQRGSVESCRKTA